ncbi:hypothetical protein NIES3974_32130 [Calothrix sp. NIES-3974]|nr:hypothetical protein NIES3974_32130 [Calothrix sp. NIES-3974]
MKERAFFLFPTPHSLFASEKLNKSQVLTNSLQKVTFINNQIEINRCFRFDISHRNLWISFFSPDILGVRVFASENGLLGVVMHVLLIPFYFGVDTSS